MATFLNSVLVLCFLSTISFSTFAEIDFKEISIFKAMEIADVQSDLVFVDFTSTQCAPCKYMEINVFKDSALGALINEHFVSVKSFGVSNEERREKAKFRVAKYPTLLILNKFGKEILRIEGKKELAQLTEIIKDIVLNKEELLIQPKDAVNNTIITEGIDGNAKKFIKPEEI